MSEKMIGVGRVVGAGPRQRGIIRIRTQRESRQQIAIRIFIHPAEPHSGIAVQSVTIEERIEAKEAAAVTVAKQIGGINKAGSLGLSSKIGVVVDVRRYRKSRRIIPKVRIQVREKCREVDLPRADSF